MPELAFDVFLSHATADKPAVEELARILKQRGIEPWLDAWNLVPGEPWAEAVEEALAGCAACAVLLGPAGIGPWQNEEMRAAIERQVGRAGGYPVIPVLLPGGERGERSGLPAFLVRRTWVEFHDSLADERALHRLVAGIRGVAPGPAPGLTPGEAVPEGACPYRGLEPFDVGDAMFFQGREALTGWLLAKLRPARADQRFLAVTGPSGSGKSSLARAGLLAALGKGELPGSGDWPLVVCRPGAQPLENLAVALTEARGLKGAPASMASLIRDLGADPRTLHIDTRLALRGAPAERRRVVLIDQFEEVFTLCTDDSQRAALIANLLHAAREPDGQTAVILTLRSDFYGRCAAFPELAAALSDRSELVAPMTGDELRSAIEGPARTAGLEIEGRLTDLLIDEVEGQPGCLPLLQHALLQIWQRREGRRLTVDAYRAIGGVAGALQRHAEEVYASFTGGQPEACRRLLLRLVQVEETGSATKRRLPLEGLVPPSTSPRDHQAAADAEAVIARLTGERLLTAEAAGEDRRPTVELAHEALVASWQRLAEWIDASREALRTRRRLDDAAHQWQASGRDPSYLYGGSRLALAAEWAAACPGEASPEAQDFLAASADRQRRQRRRAMTLLASAAVAAALAAVVTFALWQKASRQGRINLAMQLAAQARLNLPLDPLISLLLAAEAVRGQPDLPAAREALLGALALADGQPLGRPGVVAIAASGDRRALAAAGRDGTVSVWSFAAGVPRAPEHALQVTGPITGLALSSDRRWLLVRTQEDEVQARLWDLTRNGPGKLLPEQSWRPGSDPFSLDSRWLSTQRWDEPVLHDLVGGTESKAPPPFAPTPAAGTPFRMAVPGGRWLVTQAGEEAPRLLDRRGDGAPDAARPVPRVPSWRGPITAFAYHPELPLVAVGGQGAAGLVDLRSGTPRILSNAPQQSVSALAFGSRPPRLAVGWNQGRVGIFTLNGQAFGGAARHETAITALAFSPDGGTLAIAEAGGKAHLWREGGQEIPLENRDPAVGVLAFSADGRALAAGGRAGTVQLWSLGSSGVPLSWQGHAGPIRALSFSKGGRELITTGARGAVRHWPLDSGSLLRLACAKAGRDLTAAEWSAHAPPGETFRAGAPCGDL